MEIETFLSEDVRLLIASGLNFFPPLLTLSRPEGWILLPQGDFELE